MLDRRLVFVGLALSGCPRTPPGDEPGPAGPACYFGFTMTGFVGDDLSVSKPCGADPECVPPVPVALRRAVDREAGVLTEEWAEAATPSILPVASTVTLVADASGRVAASVVREALSAEGADTKTYAGEGSMGDASWSSYTLRVARQAGLTDVIDLRLGPQGVVRETAYTVAQGSIVLRRVDTLAEVPCRGWESRRDATLGR